MIGVTRPRNNAQRVLVLGYDRSAVALIQGNSSYKKLSKILGKNLSI